MPQRSGLSKKLEGIIGQEYGTQIERAGASINGGYFSGQNVFAGRTYGTLTENGQLDVVSELDKIRELYSGTGKYQGISMPNRLSIADSVIEGVQQLAEKKQISTSSLYVIAGMMEKLRQNIPMNYTRIASRLEGRHKSLLHSIQRLKEQESKLNNGPQLEMPLYGESYGHREPKSENTAGVLKDSRNQLQLFYVPNNQLELVDFTESFTESITPSLNFLRTFVDYGIRCEVSQSLNTDYNEPKNQEERGKFEELLIGRRKESRDKIMKIIDTYGSAEMPLDKKVMLVKGLIEGMRSSKGNSAAVSGYASNFGYVATIQKTVLRHLPEHMLDLRPGLVYSISGLKADADKLREDAPRNLVGYTPSNYGVPATTSPNRRRYSHVPEWDNVPKGQKERGYFYSHWLPISAAASVVAVLGGLAGFLYAGTGKKAAETSAQATSSAPLSYDQAELKPLSNYLTRILENNMIRR